MEDNEKFPQQEAPEKNSDHAFVQVGSNGKPVMPGVASEQKNESTDQPVSQEHPKK